MDIVFGCEVGGHREGCRGAMINVKDIVEEPFGKSPVAEVDNCIAVYGVRPPPTVVLHGSPEKYEVPSGRDVDAAITRFDIWCSDTGGASQPAVHIVAGNMHIVCGDNPPSIKTRLRIVKLLRTRLEECTAPEPQVQTVRLIVGAAICPLQRHVRRISKIRKRIHSGRSFPRWQKCEVTMWLSMGPPPLSSPSRSGSPSKTGACSLISMMLSR